jgi:hypothetical protein
MEIGVVSHKDWSVRLLRNKDRINQTKFGMENLLPNILIGLWFWFFGFGLDLFGFGFWSLGFLPTSNICNTNCIPYENIHYDESNGSILDINIFPIYLSKLYIL